MMQARKLFALQQQCQTTSERGHSKRGLACQNAGLPGLQIKYRRARSAASGGGFCESFEEFTRPSILAFVKGKDCLLQNRRDLLRKRLANVTAKRAAH